LTAPGVDRIVREVWLESDGAIRVEESPPRTDVSKNRPEETVQVWQGGLEITLDVWTVWRHLPQILKPHPTDPPGQQIPSEDLVLPRPYVREIGYLIHPPVGFVVDVLPKNSDLKVGPATSTGSFVAGKDQVVMATIQFDGGKPIYSPEEVRAFRTAYLARATKRAPVVRFIPGLR
jgi:hypothetical protein